MSSLARLALFVTLATMNIICDLVVPATNSRCELPPSPRSLLAALAREKRSALEMDVDEMFAPRKRIKVGGVVGGGRGSPLPLPLRLIPDCL